MEILRIAGTCGCLKEKEYQIDDYLISLIKMGARIALVDYMKETFSSVKSIEDAKFNFSYEYNEEEGDYLCSGAYSALVTGELL